MVEPFERPGLADLVIRNLFLLKTLFVLVTFGFLGSIDDSEGRDGRTIHSARLCLAAARQSETLASDPTPRPRRVIKLTQV